MNYAYKGADGITLQWNSNSYNFMRQIKIDLIEFKEVGKGNEKEEIKGMKGNERNRQEREEKENGNEKREVIEEMR